MKNNWSFRNFESCIEKIPKVMQLKTSDYQSEGKYPIVSQESDLISGYTDKEEYVNHFTKPLVVFGDHSRVIKYIDFDFAVGADGVKILIPKNDIIPKFFYYYLKWHGVMSLGYSRHYKLLKEINIPIPSQVEQQYIVEELDLLSSIVYKKNVQLHELDILAQNIFYKMFGNPITNNREWMSKKIKEIGTVVTGNTPKRAIADYYNEKYIEWIKTDNILKDSLFASQAKEYLSKTGSMYGRIVDKGALLVACIAGSIDSIGKVCITDRKVAFNQQINAIILNSNINVHFVYYLIKLMGVSIRGLASDGMKHILTKSAMEELTIPIPPLELQILFAEKTNAIEQQKKQIKQSIKEVEIFFNSRMDYYFN